MKIDPISGIKRRAAPAIAYANDLIKGLKRKIKIIRATIKYTLALKLASSLLPGNNINTLFFSKEPAVQTTDGT